VQKSVHYQAQTTTEQWFPQSTLCKKKLEIAIAHQIDE